MNALAFRLRALIPATGCSAEWLRQQSGREPRQVEDALHELVRSGYARRFGSQYRRSNPDIVETKRAMAKRRRTSTSGASRVTTKRNSADEDLFAWQCQTYDLPEPERQFYFAKDLERQFRADFAFPDYRLLVEIEGGIWRRGGGAHSHPLDLLRDIERRQYATLLNWHVLPFTTDEVKNGKAIQFTCKVLAALGWQGVPNGLQNAT